MDAGHDSAAGRRKQEHEDGPRLDHERPRGQRRRRILFGAVAASVAIVVALLGIVAREDTVVTLRRTADDQSVPRVTLVAPKPGPKTRSLTLPGDLHAWYEAPIFAQVSGYVRMWYKDYGARVQKGDVLAVVDTPDLDQELQQAEAQLEVAQTRYKLAAVTARRWQKLAGTQAVSQQEVDVNVADAAAQKASVDAARFNVARYEAQEAFKRIVAPFDGVVTARDTDVGDYVDAAGGSAGTHGAATELFSVADLHEMRVFISVPQDYAGELRSGVSASITLPQFPNQTFQAAFATTASSFNTSSRTVLTELTVPNPDHRLWPGAYAEVHFTVPVDEKVLIVPEQSLLFRAEGLQVAVVDGANKLHLQNVTVGLNLGQTVQVTAGLKSNDCLIANPSDGLLDGETVKVVDAPAANSDDDEEGHGAQNADE